MLVTHDSTSHYGASSCGCLMQDPKTGQPLSDPALDAEIAIMFLAGFETTGHTIGNAM